MFKISQNNKIAISAVAVFIVSFTSMVMFLEDNVDPSTTQANTLHVAKDPHDFAEFDEDETPVFITNVEGELLYNNDSFCKLMGGKCEKKKDESVFDYVKESNHDDLAKVYAKVLQNKEKLEALGPVVMSLNNKESLVLLGAEPVLGRKDRVEYVVFRAKDLTEQAKEF